MQRHGVAFVCSSRDNEAQKLSAWMKRSSSSMPILVVSNKIRFSVKVEQENLGRFGCSQVELRFLAHCGSIAGAQRLAIEVDFAFGDVEPGVALHSERVRNLLARIQSAEPEVSVLMDWDGTVAAGFTGEQM